MDFQAQKWFTLSSTAWLNSTSWNVYFQQKKKVKLPKGLKVQASYTGKEGPLKRFFFGGKCRLCKRTWERKIKNCIIKDWWSVDLEILDDETIIYNLVGCLSKKTPTNPWNIPQTLNYLFMKEISSFLYFWVPGVCSRGLLDFS